MTFKAGPSLGSGACQRALPPAVGLEDEFCPGGPIELRVIRKLVIDDEEGLLLLRYALLAC